MAERPQYFENTLTPLSINTTTLFESLEKLRIAVHNGAELIQENTPLPETWGPNGIFRAFPGISKSSPTSQPHNHLTTRLRNCSGIPTSRLSVLGARGSQSCLS
jgi:hypothetical protein